MRIFAAVSRQRHNLTAYGRHAQDQPGRGPQPPDGGLRAAGTVLHARLCGQGRILDPRADPQTDRHLPRGADRHGRRRADRGLRPLDHRRLRHGQGRPHLRKGHRQRDLLDPQPQGQHPLRHRGIHPPRLPRPAPGPTHVRLPQGALREAQPQGDHVRRPHPQLPQVRRPDASQGVHRPRPLARDLRPRC